MKEIQKGNIFGEIEIRRVDNPQYLGDSEKRNLLPELTRIANRAFGSTLSEKEVEEHVFPVSTLLLAEAGDKIAGFSASSHYHLRDARGDYSLVYLVGVGIDPKFQEAGLYDNLIKQRLDIELAKAGKGRVFITTRTQNPRVYGSVRKHLERIIPSENFYENPNGFEEMHNAAKEMAKILGCTIDERCVAKGVYGASKYPTLPRYKDEEVNKMFERELDISKGDGFIIVGEPRPPEISISSQSKDFGGFGQVMNTNGDPHFPCGF